MRAPVVCLHAGLLVVRRTAPEKFRAVVVHELAHIRTFDVGLAYFTLALWRAFACLVLVPYTVVVGGALALAAVTYRRRRPLLPVAERTVLALIVRKAVGADDLLVRSTQ